MFEKVNPAHPDKVADRIAGAIVDLAYEKEHDPCIAVEVLIGHGVCHALIETAVDLDLNAVNAAIHRIAGRNTEADAVIVPQDQRLAENQRRRPRCGDNGIFKGVPVTAEQRCLSEIAHSLYDEYLSDGKYILNGTRLIICQSKAEAEEIQEHYPTATVNPLGYWTGGTDVDSGATNRKLGSDMGDSVTGGGLHGKDLSKGDVSVNIYAWLTAQTEGRPVELVCAIGDEEIDGRPYAEIVEIARQYIRSRGGFERFAEWGLI